MRKLFTIVVALATLALGGVATAGGGNGGGGGEKEGDKAKFDSEITLNYDSGPYDPYDPYYEEARFHGKVTVSPANKEARQNRHLKKKCKKGRTVVIKNKSLPAGSEPFTTTTTNKKGKYSAPADEAYSEPGTYQAKVKKKRKVKAEVKCFGAKSNTVTVP
jgi:hypothetical protein